MSSNESEGNFMAVPTVTSNFAVRVEKELRCDVLNIVWIF